MENFFKRLAFMGLGIFSTTREKIKQGVDKMVKQGELTAAQGEKLYKKLVKDIEKTHKEISKRVDAGVKATMSKMGLVKKTEVEKLERRILQLEKKLAVYQKEAKSKAPAKTKASKSRCRTNKTATKKK